MDPNTTTYKQMYEGTMLVYDPVHPTIEPETDYDPTYYHGEIGFRITATHKLAQDKPTLILQIPCKFLGISEKNISAADFCLRGFKKYIDVLNSELYNRSRPDEENGKYYLPDVGGEVIARNSAYFSECPQKDYRNGGGSSIYLLNDGVYRPPILCVCIMMQVQLPKKKLKKAIQMLCRDLPQAVDRFIADFDRIGLARVCQLSEKQTAIRSWLKESEYCAFVAGLTSVMAKAYSP